MESLFRGDPLQFGGVILRFICFPLPRRRRNSLKLIAALKGAEFRLFGPRRNDGKNIIANNAVFGDFSAAPVSNPFSAFTNPREVGAFFTTILRNIFTMRVYAVFSAAMKAFIKKLLGINGSPKSVINISSARAVFKVFSSIISSYAVFVINIISMRSFSNKGVSNKYMRRRADAAPFKTEGVSNVSVSSSPVMKYLANESAYAWLCSSYSAKIAGVVKSFTEWNWLPNFFSHVRHSTVNKTSIQCLFNSENLLKFTL